MSTQNSKQLQAAIDDLTKLVQTLPVANDFSHQDQKSNVQVVRQSAQAEQELTQAAQDFQAHLLAVLKDQGTAQ